MNIISITDINSQDLYFYAHASEAELLHANEPAPGVFIAETANVILRALEAGYEAESLLVEEERLHLEAKPVFDKIEELYGTKTLEALPVYVAKHEVVTNLTGYNLVRGLWGILKRKPLQSLEEFCEGKNRLAVLYDVVNPTNVGAIIRSAAALGMDGAVLTDHSVNPLTRRSSRVSMGTVFQMPWTVVSGDGSQRIVQRDNSSKTVPDAGTGLEQEEPSLVRRLQKSGFKTLAMALTDNSVSVAEPAIKEEERLAIFLGTEGDGLPKEVIEACDYTVKIPMYHGVDSLNVAAASAVIFWELQKNI